MPKGLPPEESAGVLLHKDNSDSLMESTVTSGHCPSAGAGQTDVCDLDLLKLDAGNQYQGTGIIFPFNKKRNVGD